MQPLVSIITPVYNAERFIDDTIQSVLDQTYENWEHILVNDCSTDSSLAILDDYANQDDRIRVFTLRENLGAAVARNVGLYNARGCFVAFIDSDDMWASDKLETQMTFMLENDLAFTYTDFTFINEAGELIKDKAGVPSSLGYTDLLKNTAIACSTVILDKEKVGDFRMPLVRKGQDTATWLQIMRETHVKSYGVDRVLNYYRQVSGSISSNKFAALKRTWFTYYYLEELPFLKASYYFINYILNAIKRRI